MGISTNTRNRESFMLAINNVFGLPASVKNELFAEARELSKQSKIPYDACTWIREKLTNKGQEEVLKQLKNNEYVSWTEGTYKILDHD
jgi:hypothetical protein